MKFGAVPPDEAEGAILAHSLRLRGTRLRKGRLLSAEDVAALADAGVSEVWIARPGRGDVDEDTAAARLANAVAGPGLRVTRAATGRVNLHAEGPGLVEVDAAAVHALNAVDPGITLATLPPLSRMAGGTMVATAKIIPFAVEAAALDRAAEAGRGALRLLPPVLSRAHLIVTEVPGAPEDPEGKGPRAVRGRVEALGGSMTAEVVPHAVAPLVAALGGSNAEILLILTGSATSDVRDVAPAAVVEAGGRIERFGLPVDPGNLLFLGALETRPVIGLPGCVRSPALNGADWVMERVICGVPPSSADLAAMCVGGLLKESPVRGQPRGA